MLDARTSPSIGPQPTSSWNRSVIFIATLLLGLKHISRGGTLVVQLSDVESFPAAQAVYALFALSRGKLLLHRPNPHLPTCFAVAKNVLATNETRRMRDAWVSGLRRLQMELLPHLRTIRNVRDLRDGDLDFIIPTRDLMRDGQYEGLLIDCGYAENYWRQ